MLAEVRRRYQFKLVGYVVMPEHIHLLISAMQMRLWKDDDGLPRFWQRRFYDFNVWSEKKKAEKLHYMHMNPVKRGLASHPKDWSWSSYRFYEYRERGLIEIDPM